MTIAGAVYPGEIPEESATKKMLSFSPHFPHNVWRDGKVELGSAVLGQKETPLAPLLGLLVLFDGHLYNTDELRQEIQRHNTRLPCQTPEELIAALYSVHQENAIHWLNGNFALAIYDEQKQELLLARDRIGEKGLYWTLKDNLFLFATSLKGILASRLVPQTPDLEALSFFISFGFIPQEKSPIQGVFKLQPGHYLKVTKEKNLLIHPYWSYNSYLNKKKADLSVEEVNIAIAKAWKQRDRLFPLVCLCRERRCNCTRSGSSPTIFTAAKKTDCRISTFRSLFR